ncbi:MAG: glutamate racemase [Salibacteraceae bacterium]
MSIGFFDSGVGGLTIWKEVVKLLPHEDTIYIADSVNAPYGEKSTDEIISLSVKHSTQLLAKGAKLIVVACNTATTQAIEELRSTFSIPFIGIEPAVKPAAEKSKTNCIGVLATYGTIESEHFNKTIDIYSNEVNVITQVGEGLVRGIENGGIRSDSLREILEEHLRALTKFPIDHLVLGCTHYPLLKPIIRELIDANIEIVDSGIPVAMQTKKVWVENQLQSSFQGSAIHDMRSTGDLNVLKLIVNNELNLGDLRVNYSSLYQSE